MNNKIDKKVNSTGLENKKTSKTPVILRMKGSVDRPFAIIVIILLCIGIIMVFSASYVESEKEYGDAFYMARRQFQWAIFGVLAMIAAAWALDYRVLIRFALPSYVVALLLNLMVVFTSYGVTAGNAQRWIEIGGVRFQPSEIMKFALILILATYISGNEKRINQKGGFLPFFIFGIPAALVVFLQNHLSATIIIVIIVISMMYIGGINLKWFAVALGAISAFAVFMFTAGRSILEKYVPHAFTRLEVWRDPFKYMKHAESKDAGWQPAQSLYAISAGGLFGLGLGKSNQKHGYLPEPQNDYIFAILCEELGFIGAAIVILLFLALAWRGFKIAKNAPNKFTSLLVMGLTMQVVTQAVLNIAVVTNTIPSTGISLPFFSYGGTSLMILLAEMGLILSISKYSYTEKG